MMPDRVNGSVYVNKDVTNGEAGGSEAGQGPAELVIVYLIECEDADHFYVGMTAHFEHRSLQHRKGRGSVFTRVHGVRAISVLGEYPYRDAPTAERQWTLRIRQALPRANVSGSGGGRQ